MLERKGFGIRFGAYIIDVVIMAVIIGVLGVAMLAVPIVAALLMLVVALGYPLIEVFQARSPGKMILGMTIGREDGTPATRDQLITRTLVKFSPSIASNVLAALALVTGVGILGTLANVVGLALGITLLVLSWTPLQTVRQAFWDLKTKTAVFGKAAYTPAGFPPVMPGQPVSPGAYPPPAQGGYVPPVGQQVPPPPQA